MVLEHYITRELGWIDFNERVLSEAKRQEIPLLERLKYLAIVSSNFDEFLMVRIANLLHEVQWGDQVGCPSGLKPSEILKIALKRIGEVQKEQYRLLNEEIGPLLSQKGYSLLDTPVDLWQEEFYNALFQQEILPLLSPLGSAEGVAFDRDLVGSGEIHLYLRLERGGKERDVILPIPGNIPRFFHPKEGQGIALAERVLFHRVEQLFSRENILEKGFFRILRDADLTVDEKRDENFMKAMEELLENRTEGPTVILETNGCSKEVLERLKQIFPVSDERCFELSGPLRLQDALALTGMDSVLVFPQEKPVRSPAFPRGRSPWEILLEKDVLLNHPYESFAPVIKFIQKASVDPQVLAIKMTLYRTSGDSPVVQALLEAAKSGKQVTVLVELKARFDEGRNIRWAKKLSRAGAMVIYGVAGLKVHAKALLIVRREKEGIHRYLHLGTGNYNDKTAEIYTDFSYLTSREELTSEVASFFNAISGYSDPPEFRYLAMAPFSLRGRVTELVEREILRAEQGEEAGFSAKFNSLTDPEMVKLLYRASKAGVQVQLNVRGVCAVVPGIPGVSENIRVVSIIGRYLEHSRCYYFYNGGMEEVYLSSADWMPRNLNRRVELLFPILDKELRKQVKMLLDIAFSDNVQAHELLSDHSWKRLTAGKNPVRNSQESFQMYYREKSEVARKEELDQLKVRRTPHGNQEE